MDKIREEIVLPSGKVFSNEYFSVAIRVGVALNTVYFLDRAPAKWVVETVPW